MGSALAGEIRFNDRLLITISGSDGEPVFTKADGGSLTAQEIEALYELFYLPFELFFIFFTLALPLFFF